MLKGVLAAFGIMLGLALIPLVNLAGIPFGPFIGAYFGIRFAREQPGTYAAKGVRFGALLALLALLASSAAVAALMVMVGLSQRMTILAWIGVLVFTMYSGSMGALGAMYALLKKGR
ncbi:MAG: hypothetical protein EXR54_04430 [Dehalococcoidia bacterium]|nr:hypothetical protein [Dehalococcoidia bacterium]MSQ16798.1 hypothetical protein [Dehalococcoidia bacterium]